jgi:hypothetical protein
VRLRVIGLAFLVLFAANVALYLSHRGASKGDVAVEGYSFRLPGSPHRLALTDRQRGAGVRQALRHARALTPVPPPARADPHAGCAVRDLRIGLTDASTYLYEGCTLPPRLAPLAAFLASLPRG